MPRRLCPADARQALSSFCRRFFARHVAGCGGCGSARNGLRADGSYRLCLVRLLRREWFWRQDGLLGRLCQFLYRHCSTVFIERNSPSACCAAYRCRRSRRSERRPFAARRSAPPSPSGLRFPCAAAATSSSLPLPWLRRPAKKARRASRPFPKDKFMYCNIFCRGRNSGRGGLRPE